MKNFLFTVLVGGAVWLLFSLGSPVRVDVVQTRTPSARAVTSVVVDEQKPEKIVERADTRMPLVATRGILVTPDEAMDGTVLVTRAVDGDTIEIEGGEHVRYIGVNTPESVDPRRKVQCFGKEASAYNKKLVEGKRVRLEPDVEDRDKYHRLLRYVWLGDTMINEQLVADGYAQVMTIPPNVKYVERFKSAQTAAHEAKKGLWTKCIGSNDNKLI